MNGLRKDVTFRIRVPHVDISRFKKVARAKGQPTSEWARRILEEEAVRDEAALRVRQALAKARAGRLTDAQALELADIAKHAR